jgi:hypothetical protein
MLTATGARSASLHRRLPQRRAILAKGGRPAPALAIRLSDELNTTARLLSPPPRTRSRSVPRGGRLVLTHHWSRPARRRRRLRRRAGHARRGLPLRLRQDARRHRRDPGGASTRLRLPPERPGRAGADTLQKASAALELPSGLDRARHRRHRDQVVAEMAGGRAGPWRSPPAPTACEPSREARPSGGASRSPSGQVRAVAFEELRPLEAAPWRRRAAPAPPVPQPAPQPPAASVAAKAQMDRAPRLSLGFGRARAWRAASAGPRPALRLEPTASSA